MPGLTNRVAVLVVSCDKYSDVWKPFFSLFWRFWPECPFNVYLLSNKIALDIPKVKNLLAGDDISWSDTLRKGITLLKEKYVFLFIEDLFLFGFVNTDNVIKVFNWILESDANYVRMNPYPKPDRRYNELVGIVSRGTLYRTSTVLSVWRSSVLFNLLKSGESAWDFENHGSVRSDSYDGFYSTWENHFNIVNAIVKSKWQRRVIGDLRSLGIELNLNKRQVMTISETLSYYLRRHRARLFRLFPAKYRRKIKEQVLFNSNI